MQSNPKHIKIFKSGKTHSGYNFYEIDIMSLGEGQLSGSHFIYECPWCTDEKKNKKLYYNYRTGVGFCFRCETVVLSKNTNLEKIDIHKFSWLNFLYLNSNLDISWTDTALVSLKAKTYLSLRKFFYDTDTIQEFNLRYFTGVNGETVLLLPNNSPNRLSVDSFQTTVISGENRGPKYMTYSSDKIIYFLDKVKNPSKIVFTEGIFDAISVTKDANNGLVACPLLGKSLSKSQQKQFYQYLKITKPKEVVVALDGEVSKARRIKTCRQILSIDSSLKVYYTSLPGELDPEEAVAEGIFTDYLSRANRVVA